MELILAGSGGLGKVGESKSSGASRTVAFLTLFPLLPLLSSQTPLSTWQLSDPLEMPRTSPEAWLAPDLCLLGAMGGE